MCAGVINADTFVTGARGRAADPRGDRREQRFSRVCIELDASGLRGRHGETRGRVDDGPVANQPQRQVRERRQRRRVDGHEQAAARQLRGGVVGQCRGVRIRHLQYQRHALMLASTARRK
ncbi:MAG TPA: hypothetical protein VIA18_31010 [Polyangia bacterium]|nr:hypothetical protein [Polyangia bacterium]